MDSFNNYNFGNITQNGSNNAIVKNVNSNTRDNPDKPATDDTWKEEVQELIAKGDLKSAFALIVRAKSDDDTKNQVVQLFSRLSKLEQDTIVGTLSRQDQVLELNQIRDAAMMLLGRV